MASKKSRIKLRPKRDEVKYLHAYISWGAGFNSFRIINGETYETITSRNLRENGKRCWFNITNVKNEVNEYAKKIGVKSDLGELFICIEKDGLSYHDKEKTIQKLIDTGRTNRITLID